MIDKESIKKIVNEWLDGKGYFLTDLTVDESNRIVVEIDDKEGVWIDDCVELSKYIESRLNRDVEDFELEVGSAGIGQPFKVFQQYLNHIGDEVDVLTHDRKKLKGVLNHADEKGISLLVKQKVKVKGSKRAKIMDVEMNFTFEQLRTVSYSINFK